MNRVLMILLAAASLALAACSRDSAAAQTQAATKAPPALPADVQHVADALTPQPAASGHPLPEGERVFTATGEFISPSRSDLAPKMPGRVAAIYVDEGSRVVRGQPLLALETEYTRLEAQRANAELARATAAAAEAQRDFERKKELKAKDSIPQSTYDRSQAIYEQSLAARDAAIAAVGTSQQQLSDAVLRAPLTGVVAERRVGVGEHLGADGVAFVIYQTAPLKLRFNVPERFLARLRPGQAVTAAIDAYPSEVFSGTIRTVGGVVDPQTRTIFAEAEFANRDGRLRPGLFARVELDLK